MNSEQQQQRIMGYFIEEAREHLQTIEQGVLNLQDILHDSESINELFRAAHSIKGGAAMLGVGSIQHVAHRLEDFFKILKENPQINVDERLKSLLLAGFDPLSELLDELQNGYKISDELTVETNNRVKPVFAELESYLNQLVSDTDGEISTDTFSQQEESIPQPQELVVSQESVFQQEITTKMRDMLQLFRSTDTAESRSQLQAVCNYFQEIGNNFGLRNWTNLVTQIKNAIAQPDNSYRTLAPILIRELKEAQDLVLANRELEITVSSQLQDLLPYRFSEPEDDEVSTIFTTASGNIADESLVESFEISDAPIPESIDIDINPDVDIDLFADQITDESFDLAEIHENQIDQMDWMDGEYEITDNQHIDGPKVGASELKSLAVLFENDDIDFESAWEDIESNEANISNQGTESTSDSHDEFADLLGNDSDSNDISVPNLGGEASSIDQLFGDFPTEESTTDEKSNSLFPDDLDDSWQQTVDTIPEISLEIPAESIQSDLDGLFTEDLINDTALDEQFGVDLGMDDLGIDIVEQTSDSPIDDAIQSHDQYAQFDDINLNEINIDDIDFSDLSDNVAIDEKSIDSRLANIQDDSEALSSEEYFAEIAKQENAIASHEDFSPSEPFALTFSEEGLALLEDPFAIDENLDEALLEEPINITSDDEIISDIDNVDNFFESPEEITSDDSAEPIAGGKEFDTIDTSGLNIFDELGFDSDELDEQVTSQDSNGNPNDFLTNEIDTSNMSDNLEFLDEKDEFSSADDLGDFFAETEESELLTVGVDTESDVFAKKQVDDINQDDQQDNQLDDFFVFGEDQQPEIHASDIRDDYDDSFGQEFSNADDLGDFFDASDDINNRLDVFVDNVDNTNELDDFFNDSEESETIASDIIDNPIDSFEQNFTDSNDLGDFFAQSKDSELEESQSLEEDIIDDDWGQFGTDATDNHDFEASSADAFADFDYDQDVKSDFLAVVDDNASKANFPNVEGEAFEQISSSESSELENLFIDTEEENLTVSENDLSFDQERSLTESDAINDLTDMLNEDLPEATSETRESELTSIQEDLGDLDLEDNEISAKTTIDNLADFFQGDDDSEVSVLQMPEEDLVSDNLAFDASLDFSEFNEFTDLDADSSETSDFYITQEPETNNLEFENQLRTEELNGIDDNFDFDDLEAMIGNSGNTPSDIGESSNRNVDSQDTDTFINEQVFVSDDMNFDELEALLGDSGSLDASGTTNAITSNNIAIEANAPIATSMTSTDDFDDLEHMLRDTYAKDVGPIKTKAPTRPPITPRKPRLTDSTMRVDVKYLDSLNNLVGELVVNRNLLEQDQERLQQFITNLLHQVQLLSDVSQRMRDQYDRSLLEASLTAGRGGRSYSFDTPSYSSEGTTSNTSVSNDFEGIEFDRYNTFHVLSQEIIELIVRVRESASDIEFVVGETDQVTRQLGTITTQVQDDLKQSRMVPFAQIADRLPRGIRDRALKTGKQAELEIFGRETLIDKAILESLTDPLTHLVNNAIDHGLEDPATRQAAGKSATGRLTVRAYHQGNQTVISISDDGAGISTDKVKKSAVAKGVRSQSEVDRLNETEVYALLFEPGFSTAAQADEFKGRGVGLDVVKTCLDDIRGVIIVESVVGKGTTFTIRLPLTLSISKAMFCISDRARIAFPVDGFEDMVEVPQSQIVLNEKGQPCLPWRDTILPFQHLSNLLSYSRHLSRSSIYGKQENDELCIIILRNDTSYLALQVDQFLGEYEIVIKQLEGPIPQPAGIAGATVLGDGRVMAIANVLELFDIASGRLRPSTSGATIQPTVEEEVAADPTVLIVDDSITVRELLSLTFAKVGYRVEQAKDGQDAWEKLRAGLPCDMIFCDIEMPRMDGLDLLSRLQKDARLKDIPVAMLTSRGADRHRQSAIQLGAKGYFTKPYLEEELLSASKRLLAGETLPI